jgi:hypothetical protein
MLDLTSTRGAMTHLISKGQNGFLGGMCSSVADDRFGWKKRSEGLSLPELRKQLRWIAHAIEVSRMTLAV